MPATTALERDLVASLAEAGFARIEPPLLIAADLVRDLVGEQIARRMFVTADADGTELCLRPDYTIPVAHAHLTGPSVSMAGAYSYCGPVFRQGPSGSGEFVQAGVESLGRTDREAADAEVVALALQATRALVKKPLRLVMGDLAIVLKLLPALGLPPVWRRRLTKDFRRSGMLAADLDALKASVAGAPTYSGLVAALEGADKAAARALVADLLSIAGITTVGGRSTGDIAERFLEQATLGSSGLTPEKVEVIEKVLAVSGNPIEALERLRGIARDAGLDLAEPLAGLEARNTLLAARGIDLSTVSFSTGFGRDVDYYTGLVFEIHDATSDAEAPLVGGGRYDRLTDMLAAKLGLAGPVPAVGCAFWVERLAQGGKALNGGAP